MQTHQGIDLPRCLIINKPPTQPALLLCLHMEKSAGRYEVAWGECWCPDRHVLPLVLSGNVRATLGWQTNCFMDLRVKLALPWDRCHLNLSFRRFHDLPNLYEWNAEIFENHRKKYNLCRLLLLFFIIFGIKLCSFSFLTHFITFLFHFNSIFL